MADSSGGLPPIRGALHQFYTSLVQQADTKLLKSGPTLASGDFKRSIDGGSVANLDTLPTVTPSASYGVLIALSVAEMTCSDLRITASDAAGAEWCDQTITIQPKVFPTVVAAGTAQAVASGTITLPSGTTGDWNGCIAHVTAATTGAGQARRITAYNTSTLVATVTPNWDTTPTGTITVAVLADEVATAAILARAGVPVATLATDIAGVQSDTNDIQTRIPAALTGDGNIKADALKIEGADATDTLGVAQTGDVFPLASTEIADIKAKTDLIPASPAAVGSPMTLAPDAVDAASLKADAVTEIQTGLATSAALVTAQADLASLLARLTALRAGYLDNLSGGAVALQGDLLAVQNNTRVVFTPPGVIERPDAGTTTYQVHLLLYDEVGNMEAPDSAPTLALTNSAGTDRSARLDSGTMALVEAGHYKAIYTADVGDALEELEWTATVVEGGATRKYFRSSLIVDTTAVDFTAADRIALAAIKAQTDVFTFTGSDVKATLDGETVALTASQRVKLDATQPDYAPSTTAALAAAQAAVLAAIAALDDLSAAQVQAAAAAALAAYDGPTKAEMDAGLAPLATSAEVDGNLIADHVLRRGFAAAAVSANGDAAGGRNLLRGLRKLVNRVSMLTNPGFLTVYEENDTTEAYQQPADTDPNTDGVTELG